MCDLPWRPFEECGTGGAIGENKYWKLKVAGKCPENVFSSYAVRFFVCSAGVTKNVHALSLTEHGVFQGVLKIQFVLDCKCFKFLF